MIGKSRKLLLNTVGKLLRPVATLCIQRGVKIRDVIELLKRAFSDAAESDLIERGVPISASKLSAMTGLQRKDLNRLAAIGKETPESYDLATRVIGQWTYDRRFTSRSGRPLKLTLEGKVGTFRDLVESVSSDLNPYTVLFELERAGVAERNERGDIELRKNALSLGAEMSTGLDLLAEDQRALLETVTENIFDRKNIPNHHIRTYFDNISPEFEQEIREWFLQKGQEFHAEAREFLAKYDKDVNPKLANKPGGVKAVLTSFGHIEHPAVHVSQPKPKARRKKS